MSKILDKWQEKIEQNAFKSDLTSVNKEGRRLMKQGKTLDELPEHTKKTETVYFKKSSLPLGDWQRIYPPVDEEGKINWTNFLFGGWRNLIKTSIVMFIIAMVLLQFYENYIILEKAVECCNAYQPLN